MSSIVSKVAKGGRPRTFDRDGVLEALVELFWEKGYEATSMTDIVEATGLNKSSLYNSFGSKDVLFEQALRRYVDLRTGMASMVLDDGAAGLADIHSVLDRQWKEFYEESDRRGCLAVNSSTELGLHSEAVAKIVQHYRTLMGESLRAALTRAADRGEIEGRLIETYVSLSMTSILGLAVLVRSGADSDEVLAHLDAARHQVDSWRLA